MDSDAQSVDSLIAAGEAAYGRKEFADAIRHFNEALQLSFDPSRSADILLHIANAHDELGNAGEALDALRRAIALQPDAAPLWNNVGVVCLRLGRLEEARAAFERALTLEPGSVPVLISLGSVALKQGDPGNAKMRLEEAIAREPGHPLAHANMALTLAVFGRIEEAEEELRLAALYGFTTTAPIQERIDRLKEIRASVLERLEQDALRARLDEGNPA